MFQSPLNDLGPLQGLAAMPPWMARSIAPLIAVALAACSGIGSKKPAAPAVDPNVFPSNYKSDIMSYLQTSLIDPTDIHDAAVVPPTLHPFDTGPRYVVCVRYNARDYDGKYQGDTEKALIYFGAKINQFIDGTPELCGGAPYQPFPELAALKHLNK